MALAVLLLVQLVILVLVNGLFPRIVVLTSTPMLAHVSHCSKEGYAASMILQSRNDDARTGNARLLWSDSLNAAKRWLLEKERIDGGARRRCWV